jgi:D-lactate dehydrogenase
MKIAFYEIEGWEESIARQNLAAAELFFYKNKIDEIDLPPKSDYYDAISIFVDSRITSKVLEQFPNLKFVATRSTGYDHVDLEACGKKGIQVANVPGYGDNTVAEFAFGLILNLTRKIYHGIDQIKETGSFSLAGLRGTDLKGKTIGIIGTGRIGKEMIKIAKGFGLVVLAFDPFPNEDFAREMNFKYVSLQELLKNSDIVSLHCPYNKETHHLINKQNITFIKRDAYLINTARGGIVETDALVFALEQGILAGTGLDVLEEEGETKDELKFLSTARADGGELKTMLQNHILIRMPNVLITPHNAFNTREALERILRTTIENLKSFIEGKPVNLVK